MSEDPIGPLSPASDGGKSDKLFEITMLTTEGREALGAGDAKKALYVLSKKHDLILQVFGDASGSTGTSLIDLSQAYHIAGRQREARAMIEEAFSIYQRLHRTDQQLDRLEETMMDICAMQGHSFAVERIAKARISRLSELGAKRDADRAVTQDNLANLYLQQRRNDEAISLLADSLAIFERTSGPSARDISVCCLYLSRAYLRRQDFEHANYLERAEFYG